MRVNVQSLDLDLSPTTRDEIERRAWLSLARFAAEINTVQVILTDSNGHKGGIDKRAIVTVNPRSLPMITTETFSADAVAAAGLGLSRARRSIRKRLDRRRSRARRVITSGLLVAAVLMLGACASVDSSSVALDDEALSRAATYSWSPASEIPAEVDDELRSAIDDRLGSRGYTRVDVPDGPCLRLTVLADVTSRQQVSDPWFSTFQSRLYEEGRVTVFLTDPATREVVWRGEASTRLRYTHENIGVVRDRYVPVARAADWKTEQLVDALFADLEGARPARLTSASPADPSLR